MVDSRNFIAHVPVADALPSAENPRAFNPSLLLGGEYSFYALTNGPMADLYTNGFRRFLLWQPFGRTFPQGCYEETCLEHWKFDVGSVKGWHQSSLCVDDYLNLVELNFPAYNKLVETFVPAMREFLDKHPGCQLIAYAGTALGNPRFDDLSDHATAERLDAALAPYISLRMGVAFDTACKLPSEHWLVPYYKRLGKLGIKWWVESNPWRFDYLRTANFISDVKQLVNATPENCTPRPPEPGGFNGFLDPVREIVGEKVGWIIEGKPAGLSIFDWFCKVVPRVFNSGQANEVCLHQNAFIGQGFGENRKLSELLSLMDKTTDKNYGAYLA